MLNRDAILNRKLPSENIPIPEWDGSVVVRRLTATEYLALVQRIKGDSGRAVYHWIAAATFDDAGNRIFQDDDAAKIESTEDYVVVERLIEAILKLNPQKDVAAKN
jgi:hypothetical protein